jgi:hypothetical protein
MISDLIKPVLFKALYGSWEVTNALGIDKGSRANGYTVLLPVPADLPVFLQIALKSLLTQDQKHLVEILVIPDIPSDDFRVAFRKLTEGISLPGVRFGGDEQERHGRGEAVQDPERILFAPDPERNQQRPISACSLP